MTIDLMAIAPPAVWPQAAEDRPSGQTREPTVPPAGREAGSRFALGLKASTLGLGVDGAVRLRSRLNMRVGFNFFNYSRNLSSDGINYDSAFRLRSVQAVADWFFARSFHLSGGLLVYNGNHMTANAVVPVNQVLNADNENVISNPANPITGKARSEVRPAAPMISLGFGNLLPQTRHVGFSVDFGVVFQGAPHSTLTLNGSACDVTGEFCANVAGDPSIQAQALQGRQAINKELFFLKYYPFVSLELGYRF